MHFDTPSFVLSGFIMRSLRLNRAVVEAQTCGRWSPIVQSLKTNRAVVAVQSYGQIFGVKKKNKKL